MVDSRSSNSRMVYRINKVGRIFLLLLLCFLISKKLSKKLKKVVESRFKINRGLVLYTWDIIKSESFIHVKMEEREDR